MNDERKFSDEELTGFLDGESDDNSAREITAQLAHDIGLNKRLAALDIDKTLLKSSFAGLADNAPEMPAELISGATVTVPAKSIGGWRQFGVAMIVAIGIGSFILGYSLNRINARESWVDYVAAYHKLYVTQTLSGVQDEPDTQLSQLAKTSDALGLPIRLEALTGSDELEYKRSQILGYGGRAIAQMTFLTPLGSPIALCIIRGAKDYGNSVELSEMEKMASAQWSYKGYEFLLIGGEDADMIERGAQYFQNQFSGS